MSESRESLEQQILTALTSGSGCVLIRTHEEFAAAGAVAKICQRYNWAMIHWDADNGTQLPGDKPRSFTAGDRSHSPIDTSPITALNALRATPTSDGTENASATDKAVLVMRNFAQVMGVHLSWLQATINTSFAGRGSHRHVVVIGSPTTKVPPELAPLTKVIDHELPNFAQRRALVIGTVQGNATDTQNVVEVIDSPSGVKMVQAVAGLNGLQIEELFSSLLIKHNNEMLKITVAEVQALKADQIRKEGTLEVLTPTGGFDTVGGMASLKNFMRSSIESPHRNENIRPKGVLVLGVPGVGKSAIVKALGYELSLPVIKLDVGALMGGIVGQTEERTRKALATIDAMAPAILMMDEVEKMLSGAGGGHNDSGVSDRQFAALLGWMNDHTSDVYVVATCNDIRPLARVSSGAFLRAGRFDGVFFADLPDQAQKAAIWDIWIKYCRNNGLPVERSEVKPKDDMWTGAEIQDCCVKATLQGISLLEAAHQVIPVANTSKENINELQQWADNRCLDASRPGMYRFNPQLGRGTSSDVGTETAAPTRRRVRAAATPAAADSSGK